MPILEALKLDKTVPIPLYFQLKRLLLDALKSGEYPVDAMIPTEKELAEMFDISRTTVRQAVTEMVKEGWLYRVKSKGTFVARRKINQDFIKRLETFHEQIARTGRKPGTQLMVLETADMPKGICQLFGVAAGGSYVHMFRRRFADDEPIVTVDTYLPLNRCAFVLSHDLSRESLYNILALDDKTRICRVTRMLEAVAANTQDADHLGVRRGKPIQLSATIGYNDANEPIEYSVARYRGDRNRFEVDLLIDTSVK